MLSLTVQSPQRGEKVLAGQEEKDIPSHRFPPDEVNSRTICFKGERLSIYNQQTDHLKTSVEDIQEYTEYEVPPGYTCYVIGASLYFKV